ncbi:MAG: c-type cytochrome [Candidatus Promineifilaceae bacterium]|nr:c-type cytochrome [Candidatus Promineifilaceae bacterium]
MGKWLKRIGLALGGILGLLVVIFIGLAIYANAQFKPTYDDRPLYPITADTSPEGLARGTYLMEEAMLCAEACHSMEAPFTGGAERIDEGPISGVFAPPNLTPHEATGLGSWADAEIARALREGVDKDGVGLIIMPSYNYRALSDDDVAAVVGYLRNLEPVENEVPPVSFNLPAKILNAVGAFGPSPVGDPITERQETPEQGTVANGEYMVKLGACSDCHQANLAGGPLPFSGPDDVQAANLTPAGEIPSWTVEQFIAAVSQGQHPSGTTLDEGMPRYGTSEADLADIYAYLLTLDPIESE